MTDRNANSYDLHYARQVLARLLPKKPSGGESKNIEATSAYTRLTRKASSPPGVPSSTGAETAVQDAPPAATPAAPEKFTCWEDCIAWCMQATRAEAAFVVDSQGFVIATRGRIPAHGFECTGAELVYAMDQLERIDPEAGNLLWIDLDYHKRRLVGFVTPAQESEYFVVGMVGPDASYNAHKNTIARQVVENLAAMN
jgi:hypothetical protein